MASLTPLSKKLIGLAVVGAMASAVWHLALKDRFASKPETPSVVATQPHGDASSSHGSSTPPLQPPLVNGPGAKPESNPNLDPNPNPSVTIQAAAVAPEPSVVPQPAQADASGFSAAEHAEKGRQMIEAGNFQQARGYLEKAVEGGDGGAACHLGDMFLKGQGGLHASPGQAAKLYQLAQSRGIICFAAGK